MRSQILFMGFVEGPYNPKPQPAVAARGAYPAGVHAGAVSASGSQVLFIAFSGLVGAWRT